MRNNIPDLNLTGLGRSAEATLLELPLLKDAKRELIKGFDNTGLSDALAKYKDLPGKLVDSVSSTVQTLSASLPLDAQTVVNAVNNVVPISPRGNKTSGGNKPRGFTP